MRGVAGLVAASMLAAAQCAFVQLARAEMAQDDIFDSSFLYFSGADLWRNGVFLHGGILWSPDGLSHEGFALKLMWGGGAYRYNSGALGDLQVIGREVSAAIMPGWRFQRENVAVTVFAGLDSQEHRLFPDDPASRLRGNTFGLRGAFDLWYEPTATMMLAADASASSIGPSYSARGAFGWLLFDLLYAGPEISAFACDDYRQFRFGAHLTGLRSYMFEWSGSLGQAWDSDHRSSVYGRISYIVRR